MLYIYRLTRNFRVGYDEMLSCIVQASSFDEARQIAASFACDEGAATWRDAESVECLCIGAALEEAEPRLWLRAVFNG